MISIKEIELEITNYCNAKCPMCARTQYLKNIKLNHLTVDQIKKNFPTEIVKNKRFKLSGIIGEPIVNPYCFEIVHYLVSNGGIVNISTNGSYRSSSFWSNIGKLSSKSERLFFNFCVDGCEKTNSIYRVNTDFNNILKNMTIYSQNGGQGTWVYNIFRHNENEIEKARSLSKKLKFDFAIRTSVKKVRIDFLQNYNKIIKYNKKEFKNFFVNKEQYQSNTSDFLDFLFSIEKDTNKMADFSKTIQCKYIHDEKLFISSYNELWPCCFIWDSIFKHDINFAYEDGWNNLNKYSIEKVLNHKFFTNDIYNLWNVNHQLFFKRCVITCANNKKFQHEIIKEVNNGS